MTSFCAAFNYSNCGDRKKYKSNYRFPSIVKNNGKEALKLQKWEGKSGWLKFPGKYWLREGDAFCLTFIGFFTQGS